MPVGQMAHRQNKTDKILGGEEEIIMAKAKATKRSRKTKAGRFCFAHYAR